MEFTLSIFNRSNDRRKKVLFIIYKQRNRRQAMCVNIIRCVRETIALVEKHYSECLSVALDIQHGKGMRRIKSPVTCLELPYFSTLSHKRQDFLKKGY